MGENVGQRFAQESQALAHGDPSFQKEAADLIDHRGTLAHQAGAHPMQSLEVKLLGRLCRHKPHRRSLNCFGDSLGIAEVVFVPFAKRLGNQTIRWRF